MDLRGSEKRQERTLRSYLANEGHEARLPQEERHKRVRRLTCHRCGRWCYWEPTRHVVYFLPEECVPDEITVAP